MSRCKYCNALIDWVQTESGRKMPVDPQVITIIQDNLGDIEGITLYGQEIRGKLTYMTTPGAVPVQIPHYKTCKNKPAQKQGRRPS